MKRVLVVCATALVVAATGCGAQTSSGGLTDAAKLAPAGTLAYASLELAPQGDTKADFDAAFGKLLGPDPESKLGQLLTDAAKEEGSKLDYTADVKPWLGETASAVLTAIAGGKPDYAILLASTDDGKAAAAIDKDLAGKQAQSLSYRGVDYRLLSDGTANGVVDHFLVAGTEKAFKAIVDTDKDGNSLADSDSWKQSVGDRADGRVGLGYLDLKGAFQSLLSGAKGPAAALAPLALGFVRVHPLVATLDVNPSSLVLDVSSPGSENDKGGPTAASSPLIETLPGDSWAALALPNVGGFLRKIVGAFKANPLIGAQYAQLTGKLRSESGLDLDRDVLAGVGDVGAFVHGTSTKTIGGGVVIAAADKAALRRTLARLPRLLSKSKHASVRSLPGGFAVSSPSLPKPIVTRAGGPGAVGTYGPARQALAPATRLGTTALFREGAAALGARPTLFIAIAPIVELARATGHHQMSAEEQARLGHLDYLVLGVRRDAGLDVVRAVLGIH